MSDLVSSAAHATAGKTPAKSSPDSAEQENTRETHDGFPAKQFPGIVALGGAAGSLDPLQRFFGALREETGVAFIVMVHPPHERSVAESLRDFTAMPVKVAQQKELVQPNTVFVIPEGKQVTTAGRELVLEDLDPDKAKQICADLLFRTVADTCGPNAIAIVLSGNTADGSIGIKRVKERGGLTIAQDPGEALHDGMLRSAINTGLVDWVFPAHEIAERLVEFLKQQRAWEGGIPLPSSESVQAQAQEHQIQEVLSFLRARTGRDFSAYKRPTVVRRIARRMQVNGTEGLPSYLALLRRHPGEAALLLQDLLISVTNFFRDRDAFRCLEQFIPELFRNKGPNDTVRVWVPACATGEEAYSIAMLLSEHVSTMDVPVKFQIFATDLDENAILSARNGLYPETIVADVSDERLRRFFTRQSGQYRVNPLLRENILFAVHDALKDAPFSRLDFISLRNFLIYLNRAAQRRLFETFHFSAVSEALLFLGSSETVDEATDLFSQVDKKFRIYRRRSVGRRVPTNPPALPHFFHINPPPSPLVERGVSGERARTDPAGLSTPPPAGGISPAELHFRLIEQMAPPSLVITREGEVIHLSPNAGRYLKFSGGIPTANLLQLVHPVLRAQLRAALFRVIETSARVDVAPIAVEFDGVSRAVSLTLTPSQDYVLLTLREDRGETSPAPSSAHDTDVIRSLEREVELHKQQLRDMREQHGASLEEMRASNEELQATNEELRSASEELETSREELQSINEELVAVNGELKSKVDELARANSDLQNLMAATNIATVFLDEELRIQLYTPPAVALFKLIPTDTGRPLSDLAHRRELAVVVDDAKTVLEKLAPLEREVQSGDDQWFYARATPYRTSENQIAGVVLTFVDISERKRSGTKARESEEHLRATVNQTTVGICRTDFEGRVLFANQKLAEILGYNDSELIGRSIPELTRSTNLQEHRKNFYALIEQGRAFRGVKKITKRDGSDVWVDVNLSATLDPEGRPQSIVAVVLDVTESKRAELQLRTASENLELRVMERTSELYEENRERLRLEKSRRQMLRQLITAEENERGRISRGLHDDVGQDLTALALGIKALRSNAPPEVHAALASMEPLIETIGKHVHDLALELRPTALDDLGLVTALSNYLDEWSARTGVKTDLHAQTDQRLPAEIETTIYRVASEALTNVFKHAEASHVSVIVERRGDLIVTVIEDDGRGYEINAHDSERSKHLGQVGMRERALLVDGELNIESKVGQGTSVFLTIPLKKPSETKNG